MPFPLVGALSDPLAFAATRYGPFRAARAAATLPATTQTPYFTIAGGRVLAFLLGEVTTVIQTQACNASLVHSPAAGTDAALCGVLNISADEVGTLYTITGIPGDALLGAGQAARFQNPVLLKPGTVDLLTSATNTGATSWDCLWCPLDEGASVVAA